MKFFIDTANLKEIHEANELGILDGVTTNPSLISKERISTLDDLYKHYKNICEIIDGDISVEVISNRFKDIIKEGEYLASINKKIVIKVPITEDGIKSIKHFKSKKIKTNCTLVFSTGQAIIAAKAGANYLSPFIGRLDDIFISGISFLKEIRTIYNNYNIKTNILAASIRNPIHVLECAKIGIDVITAPLKIIKNIIKHPLTDLGLEKFLKDYKSNNF